MEGRIQPRPSWPRPATATTLVPAWAGEFCSFQDWVNFATQRLTGTVDPLMGAEIKAICIDALGRRCTMGAHFMRAREEGAFPVRFFWDCIEPHPTAPEWRPEVRAFADLMEAQLRANDHKPGWKDEQPWPLVKRVYDEMEELENELHRGSRTTLQAWRDRVAAEAADVANFAMMIADVCGALAPLTASTREGAE